MYNHRAGVVVADQAGRLVGIFTERDLLTRGPPGARLPGHFRGGNDRRPGAEPR
jgi:CBS domain-containing protein